MGTTERQPAQPDRTSVALLRSYAERIVRLKEEIKGLQSDIKDIKTEADGQGFDKKALMVIVSRMMESETDKAKRIATESYADIYLASLGMLDGTPLGDAARRHLMNPPRDPEDEGEQPGDEGGEPGEDRADAPPEDKSAAPGSPPAGAMSQEMVDAAREEGAAGARSGAGVFANPYVAGDPRRAAWDEGWCRETGSDGMDLPAAFRRPSKPRKGDADRRPGGER